MEQDYAALFFIYACQYLNNNLKMGKITTIIFF